MFATSNLAFRELNVMLIAKIDALDFAIKNCSRISKDFEIFCFAVVCNVCLLLSVVIDLLEKSWNLVWFLSFIENADVEFDVSFFASCDNFDNFTISMKSRVEFDREEFDSDRFEIKKTNSKLWFENSYNRDLKLKFVKLWTLDVISKIKRTDVNEDVNDRLFALWFKIRSIMLN